jgi:hypothetical protein
MNGSYASSEARADFSADRISFETSAVVLIADLLERSYIETIAGFAEQDPARAHAALDATLHLVEQTVGMREAMAESRIDRTVLQIVRASLTVVVDNARSRIPTG